MRKNTLKVPKEAAVPQDKKHKIPREVKLPNGSG